MARIRTIKPEIWTDPEFVECSTNARLLFVASLNFATDYGVLRDKAIQLKMQCFPGDAIDVAPLIEELIAAGFYVRTTAPDGAKVILIRTFSSHQRVDKPQAGRWGNPADWPKFDEPSTNDLGPIADASPTEGKGMEGNGKGREGSNPLPVAVATSDANAITPPADRILETEFAEWWQDYPRKTDRIKALKAWKKTRKAGATVADLTAARNHYAAGSTTSAYKYGATFLGPDQSWRDWVNGTPDEGTPQRPNNRGPETIAEKHARLTANLGINGEARPIFSSDHDNSDVIEIGEAS